MKECLKKVNFYRWVLLSEPNPERLRNILYQVCQVGRRSQCVHWIDEFLITCILHVSLKYVEEILKFINSPSLNQEFYSTVSAVVFSMRRTQNNSNLQNALRRRSLRRRTLLLHLFWNYLMLNLHTYTNEERAPVDVSVFYKGLRLFWDSVPDSFLSFEEIKTVFIESVDLKVIGDVASFYSKAIDEFHAVVEPRPLQHYCRTAIRRRLWERDQWLPEGIRKTRLPPKLQSYLNLNPI
ncbi:uncharacterized protein LOC129960411 [Argiope bruennichi]|uniref:uncharacterized protein LOC129960411 n=1 Tax=Argiope bruennichi TaxID=94029 RepID=UPI002493F696|nr:uncharacterized protein LOC129960411 [Argiope bruennichi]